MVGVMNWIVQKVMSNEAKRIAKMVKNRHDSVKKRRSQHRTEIYNFQAGSIYKIY